MGPMLLKLHPVSTGREGVVALWQGVSEACKHETQTITGSSVR